MMLAALSDAVFDGPEPTLKASYRAPMRTYARKYAQMLGYPTPAECPPAAYNLPEDRRRELFASHATTFASPKYLETVFHGIGTLLAIGIARGLIPTPPSPLRPWPLFRRLPNGVKRPPKGRIHLHIFAHANRSPYAIKTWPARLAQDTQSYLDYCQKPIARGRSWKIVKRDISRHHTEGQIARLAGYAVTQLGLDPDTLDLTILTDIKVLDPWAWWRLERRGESTAGIRNDLGQMLTIAKHWVKDEGRVRAIQALFGDLPPAVAVRDKEALWLDMEELDLIGQSRHPANARRFEGPPTQWTQFMKDYLADPDAVRLPPSWLAGHGPNMKTVTMWIGLSLMIRFWCHRPLRSRQVRELKVSHLIRQPNGRYEIVLKGEELKVSRRRGHVNRWEAHFPQALLPQLEEWLTRWRPRIAAPDSPFLFVNSRGQPFTGPKTTEMLEWTTWNFTQERAAGPIALNPHQIRTLWGTQMVLAKLDILTIARLLGDNIQMVYERYVLNQQPRPISQWTKDLAHAISEGTD
jgi:Phage integrase family